MHIWLRSLSKRYPGIRVMEDVSAEIGPGQTIALLGSNGAGKTTLLRCLTTLSAPDSGQILIDDEELRRGRLDLRRRMMFLPDFPPLFAGMDPLATVAMHVKLWEADRPGIEHRVAELIDRLDLAALSGLPVETFSRGQRYKTALAALLAVDPELWLLDEPFASGMDPMGISTFRTEARAAASERGRIVLYSTQIVDLAVGFSDRIAVLRRGELRLYDTKADLQSDPEKLSAILSAPHRQ